LQADLKFDPHVSTDDAGKAMAFEMPVEFTTKEGPVVRSMDEVVQRLLTAKVCETGVCKWRWGWDVEVGVGGGGGGGGGMEVGRGV